MKKFAVLFVFIVTVSLFAASLSVKYDEGAPSVDFTSDSLIKPDSVQASSFLENKALYSPNNVADENASSAWCEGAAGNGKGEWIRLNYKKPVTIAGILFTPFYAKNKASLLQNGQVKTLQIEGENGFKHTVTFMKPGDDVFDPNAQISYPGPYIHFTADNIVKSSIKTTWLKFTILEVYPGSKFTDTCISEISVSNTE